MSDDHPLTVEFWAEGITIEGTRLTTEEAEAFLTEARSLLDTVESEQHE